MKEYPAEFSKRLADEIEPMPEDSAATEFVTDCVALRDMVRACR